jgi:hypothetical protein
MQPANHNPVCMWLTKRCKAADAEQLFTDAALVLDTSTRVAAAAGSGLIDLHLHCVVDHPDETGWVAGCINCAHDLACITCICDAQQTIHRRSARARHIYTCSSGHRKRQDRSALALRRRPCRWVAGHKNRPCDAMQVHNDEAVFCGRCCMRRHV